MKVVCFMFLIKGGLGFLPEFVETAVFKVTHNLHQPEYKIFHSKQFSPDLNGARARNRQKLKAFKVKNGVEDFVVSKYITVDKVEGMSQKDLVVRMEYLKMTRLK